MKYDNDKRRELAQRTAISQALRRLGRGAAEVRNDRRELVGLLLILLAALLAWTVIVGAGAGSLFAPLYRLAAWISALVLAVGAAALLFWMCGGPLRAGQVQDNLYRAGVVNAAGEQPTLVSMTQDPDHNNIEVYNFELCGLSIEDWLTFAPKIQTALNRTVVDVRYGADHQHIQITTVPPMTVWPINLPWLDRYLALDDFVLTLGVGAQGRITWNLADIPHGLLGGSTGSGKTTLLKVLLRQAVQRGGEVYIADFKGGVDYGRWWHDTCELVYDMDGLMEMLDKLVGALVERRKLLQTEYRPNIDKYNAAHPARPLHRLIFACDEVAAMLDKTGRTKEQKEQIDKVIDKLSLIAQQGRAFGIHLILATQRPDANLIPGQIRSNLDFKVCGRADSVLSSIIIDSTAAADLIPKDAKGRFVLNDGRDASSATVFQGYTLFDELQ